MRKDQKINYNLIIPNNFWAQPVFNFKGQTIFFYERSKYTKWFVGFVMVVKIEKGTDYDVICGMTMTGKIKEENCKRFICKNRNSRNQIYTLHKNEWAIIFGKSAISNSRYFLVEGIWATYVPKAYEIKSHLKEESKDELDILTNENNQETLDFLDEILSKRKENEDE